MKKTVRISYLIIAIVAIGIAVWQFVAAPFNDDFVYRHQALATTETDFWDLVGEPIEGLGDALVSAWNHWRLVNGRLSNILMTFSVLIDPWMVDLLHGVIVGAMLWLVIKCIEPRRGLHLPWIVGMIALVMWKYLPWHDSMVSSDFLFNYTWSSVAALGYSYVFIYSNRTAKVYPLIIAFIAGWMHEGFSLPLLCASVVSLPFVPKELRRHRIAMIIALAVGAALCALAPSTLMRLDRNESHDLFVTILKTFSQFYSMYIYIIVMLIVALTRGWHKALDELKQNVYWLALIVANVTIVVVVSASHRAIWMANIALLIALLSTLLRCYEWCRKPHLVIATVATLIVVAFMAELIKWQYKLAEEQYEIMEYLQKTKSPDLYMDLTEEHDLPWWVLGIPKQYSTGGYGSSYYMMRSTARLAVGQDCLYAPARFEGLPFEKWDKVPGENPFYGVYPCFYSHDSIPYENITVHVGEPYRALSPMANMLQKIIRADSVRIDEIIIRRCMTSSGDTIYRYSWNMGRMGQSRQVKSIDVK